MSPFRWFIRFTKGYLKALRGLITRDVRMLPECFQLNGITPAERIRDDAHWKGLKKLHLGCGTIYLESYVNSDIPNATEESYEGKIEMKVDLALRLDQLGDLESESYDVIECYHVVEHIYECEADPALKEIYRILKPGGEFHFECPDIWKCSWNHVIEPDVKTIGYNGFFGVQHGTAEPMVHKRGLNSGFAADWLVSCGFSQDLIFHLPARRYQQRDLRVSAFKATNPSEAATYAAERREIDTIARFQIKETAES